MEDMHAKNSELSFCFNVFNNTPQVKVVKASGHISVLNVIEIEMWTG